MPHDNNGRIYISNGHGIDIRGDVAYVLGRRSGDVGHLCGDTDDPMDGGTVDRGGKINRWSAHKPVEVNTPRRLTDQDFAAIHYGMDAHARLGSYMQSDYSDFFWGYARPQTFYRVLDFDGYNHKAKAPDLYTYAYPIYVNMPAENGRFRITFYEDADEIPILNEEYKTTSQTSATKAALSNWHVVLLVYVPGNATMLYNTGKTLSEFTASGLIDYHEAIHAADVGKSATLVPALVYPNSQMTVGMNTFSGSFLNNYYFIPLSFTEQMEGMKEVVIAVFYYLEGMSIGHSTMTRPHTGYNYYSFTSIGVVATKNNMGSATGDFRLRFGIKRTESGVEKKYYSRTQYEYSLTTSSGHSPFEWDFPTNASGTITFIPAFVEESSSVPVSLQSGDVFFLEVALMSGGQELQVTTVNVGTQE